MKRSMNELVRSLIEEYYKQFASPDVAEYCMSAGLQDSIKELERAVTAEETNEDAVVNQENLKRWVAKAQKLEGEVDDWKETVVDLTHDKYMAEYLRDRYFSTIVKLLGLFMLPDDDEKGRKLRYEVQHEVYSMLHEDGRFDVPIEVKPNKEHNVISPSSTALRDEDIWTVTTWICRYRIKREDGVLVCNASRMAGTECDQKNCPFLPTIKKLFSVKDDEEKSE